MRERAHVSRRAVSAAATGVPLLGVAWWLVFVDSVRRSDLRVFVVAGSRVLQGHTPYLPLTSPDVYTGSAFVYPAAMAWFFTPFSLVPFAVADVLFYLFSISLVLVSLYLFGVRHPVPYLAVMAAGPTIRSLQVGAVNAMLLAMLALGWRYRRRWPLVGIALGAAVVSKLFLAPMVFWLAITRRFRAAAAMTIGAALVVLVGCESTHIGVSGFRRLLSTLGIHESSAGYSVVGALVRDGLPYGVAQGAAVALALVVIGYAWRSHALPVGSTARDAHQFICCVVAALIMSPVVWSHYLVLLIVAPALMRVRPRSWILLALASWIPVIPAGGPHWLYAFTHLPAWVEHGSVYVALVLAVVLPPRLRRQTTAALSSHLQVCHVPAARTPDVSAIELVAESSVPDR